MKYLRAFSLLLIAVGAINWGLVGTLRFNLVSFIVNFLGLPDAAVPILYAAVGAAGAYSLFRRDFYLPFLGNCVFPCGSLAEKTPGDANVQVTVLTKPLSNVVFWAAEPGTEVAENPWVAYKQNANAGVTRSDSTGKAVLRVRRPMPYRVPIRGVLQPHVHYRTCFKDGMLGPVQTAFLE